MAKIKSVPTFLRKQLKIKGATSHNGRGVYEMDMNCETKELQSSVYTKLGQWKEQGIVESSVFNERDAGVVFKEDAMESKYYRHVEFYFTVPAARVFC